MLLEENVTNARRVRGVLDPTDVNVIELFFNIKTSTIFNNYNSSFKACNCNAAGAKNDICNIETGQCDCYDKVLGKKCDECQPNFWRFPACEACNCNGFADSCNQTTGICINCRDNTQGFNCEK